MLGAALAGTALARALAMGCAQALPVHIAPAGATMADGSPLGGAVVRLEQAPGRTVRGAVLELPAGRGAAAVLAAVARRMTSAEALVLVAAVLLVLAVFVAILHMEAP